MFTPSSVIVNGNIYPAGDYFINPFSPSFQYGLNIFEGIRGYILRNKKVNLFLLREHLSRLKNSAVMMHLSKGLNLKRVAEDISLLINNEPPKNDIYLKVMVYPNSNGSWNYIGEIDTCVFYYDCKSSLRCEVPVKYKTKFTSFNRLPSNSSSPFIKAGANYINSRFGYLDVNPPGTKSETLLPLFLNDNNHVSESSGSCIFAVIGGKIYTPDMASSILPSITRRYLLNHFQKEGVECIEGPLTRWQLYSADEIFLCGTNIEVGVVVSIDNHKINNEETGPLALSAFTKLKSVTE